MLLRTGQTIFIKTANKEYVGIVKEKFLDNGVYWLVIDEGKDNNYSFTYINIASIESFYFDENPSKPEPPDDTEAYQEKLQGFIKYGENEPRRRVKRNSIDEQLLQAAENRENKITEQEIKEIYARHERMVNNKPSIPSTENQYTDAIEKSIGRKLTEHEEINKQHEKYEQLMNREDQEEHWENIENKHLNLAIKTEEKNIRDLRKLQGAGILDDKGNLTKTYRIPAKGKAVVEPELPEVKGTDLNKRTEELVGLYAERKKFIIEDIEKGMKRKDLVVNEVKYTTPDFTAKK